MWNCGEEEQPCSETAISEVRKSLFGGAVR